MLPPLPSRPRDAHKGSVGRVMVVAGSRGMAGAAVMTGEAAYRSGAGLVYYCVPDEILDTVAAKQTCGVILPMGSEVVCEAAAVGPGLGEAAEAIVPPLLTGVSVPLILDADGIRDRKLLKERKGPLVITPHPGEFRRLTGQSPDNREKSARDLAKELKCVVVLKGMGTVVTDGEKSYTNETGNPGMATGGSGDVLTGVIAALTAQGMNSYEAAVLGVYLHGMAGDLAAEKFGEISMMATDILDWLPQAFEKYRVRTALEKEE